MVTKTKLKLGALGGPVTFGGQAALLMKDLYPEFGEITFFPRSEEVATALREGRVDATVGPVETARADFMGRTMERLGRPNSRLYVLAEANHAYHCSLLVKPGTHLEKIRWVGGHTGSVSQCRGWLKEHLPNAEVVIVDTSSMGAADDVAKGDGTLASIGTPEAARFFGLEELSKEIDGSAVGCYWATSPQPLFSEAPSRVIVAGRLGGDGQLGDLVAALAGVGYRLLSAYGQASGSALFVYDYLLRFGGAGKLSDIQRELARLGSVRLIGAFEARQ